MKTMSMSDFINCCSGEGSYRQPTEKEVCDGILALNELVETFESNSTSI